MLPALFDEQRQTLRRVAAMLVLGAAAVLPLTAQTSSVATARETAAATFAALPSLPGPLTYAGFALKRDPFRARQTAPADTAAAYATAGASDVIAVRAIVVGERKRALVEIGGALRVLSVGEAIGDRNVTAISRAGVRLSDGSLLPLPAIK